MCVHQNKYAIVVIKWIGLQKHRMRLTNEEAYMDIAFLSSCDGFTVFRYGKHTIRFRAPYSLERYTEVKQWDKGYLVVMAKYNHSEKLVEEYIDLVPVLEDLYFDVETFLEPIREVWIGYDEVNNQLS